MVDNVISFSTEKVEEPEVVKLTEDAQAKAFVDIQNDCMRYVEEIDQWYIHNGHYWEEISKKSITESARLMNRGTAITIDKAPALKRQLSSLCFAQQVGGFAEGHERRLSSVE